MYARSAAPASSLALSAENSGAFRRILDPDQDPGRLAEPSPDAYGGRRPVHDLDDVTDVDLPTDLRKRLKEGLAACGEGPGAMRKAVAGPLRELRETTRDPILTREVGLRFAAMQGNGLIKAWPQRPGMQPMMPQPGMQPSLRPIPPQALPGQQPQQAPVMPGAGMPQRPPVPSGPPATPRLPPGMPPAMPTRMPPQMTGGAGGMPVPPAGPAGGPGIPSPPDLQGHDAASFNALPKHERAKIGAGLPGLAGGLEQHAAEEPYDNSSHQAARVSAAKHVRQLVRNGALGAHDSGDALQLVGDMHRWAKEAKVDPAVLGDLLHRTVQKIGAQPDTLRATLAKIRVGRRILDALQDGGKKLGPKDYLGLAVALLEPATVSHMPALQGAGVKDDFRGAAARRIWEQQPELAEAFGHEGWQKLGEVIEGIGGTDVNWEGDSLASAARLADALGATEAGPEHGLLRHTKGAELLGRIHALQQDGGADSRAGVEALRGKLLEHVDSRPDLPPEHRAELQGRLDGITPSKGETKLPGKDPRFAFKNGKLVVSFARSPAVEMMGSVFGGRDDEERAVEMLKDPGVLVTYRSPDADDPTEKAAADGRDKALADWQAVKQAKGPEQLAKALEYVGRDGMAALRWENSGTAK